jgi:hypothetical protein
MTKKDLLGLNSKNLASILNQLEYKALATRVSNNNMNGDVFLNIPPNIRQFVFSDSTERNQFEAFMLQLNTKITAPIINTPSPTLETSFTISQNILINNSSLHFNDDYNSTIKTLTSDQSKMASSNYKNDSSSKENNQFDPSLPSVNSQQIKAPEWPYIFQFPSDKLSDELQSKLSDVTALVNSSDVSELIKQAFNKMRSYKM